MPFTTFYIINVLGIIAFTISGVLVALNKKMDVFGIAIIGFVTAVGGGTLRDLLMGNTPVSWMIDVTYTYVIIGSVIFAILLRSKINYLRTSLFLFDTIGIGMYTLIGIQKGIDAHLHPVICIIIGTISASFGGVIRDILCNEIPVIFRQEIYATACIFGGVVYFLLRQFPIENDIAVIIAGSTVMAMRLLAVKFKISLPKAY